MVNCHNCGRPYEVWESTVEHPYQYTESGLPNIQLAGVTVYSCPNCQLESADIPNLDGLHELISRGIIVTPLPMTGAELRFLRKETRLKPKEFAERLGVDPKTISNWETSPTLSRQNDVTIRLFVATVLWPAFDLAKVLKDFAEIAKYGWETSEASDQEISQLAADNTVLGLGQNQQWGVEA